MSKTLQQKMDHFLLMHGLMIHAEVKEVMCPPWCDNSTSPYRCPDEHGNYYRVSLMRDEKTMFELDYWDIFHGGDEKPTHYEILACLKHYASAPDNVLELMHKITTKTSLRPNNKRMEFSVETGKKLRAFLTSDELDGLLNINK